MFRSGVNKRKRIADEYKILSKIGEGSFGIVYKVVDREGHYFAAKFEKPRFRQPSQLKNELNLLPPYRQSRTRREGQVYTHYCGFHGGYGVVVIDLLGRSMHHKFKRYGRLSVQSVLMFGIQALLRIEALHEQGLVHRDIKPDNFMTGRHSDKNVIYLIDLGMASNFRNPRTGQHVVKRRNGAFCGSKSFAARASHRGETHSRRSDLESLVYCMVFLHDGRLPWEYGSEKSVGKMKESIKTSELCGNLPNEVAELYRQARGLSFEGRPNYSKLRQLLIGSMKRHGFKLDHKV